MNRMSLVTRLYVGFGLLCLIMALLGGFNLKVLSAFSTNTQQLTSDVFPLDESIQHLETLRSQTGILALALVSAETESQLNEEQQALTVRVQAMREGLHNLVKGTLPSDLASVAEFRSTASDRLASLEASVTTLAELKTSILSVASAVEAGLESFLANNAEMKRLLVREGTEPAGRDIYVRDLFTTVMENLTTMELLIMQMVSTDDAERLDAIVENLRFNTVTIEQDMSALAEEVPRLEGLPSLMDSFLASINQDEGIISQYSGFRQSKLTLDQRIADVELNLQELASELEQLGTVVSDVAAATVVNLDTSAQTAVQLVMVLLPALVVFAAVVSFVLGRMISRPLQQTQEHLATMASGDYSESPDFRASGEFIGLKASLAQLTSAMGTVIQSLQQAGTDISVIATDNSRFARDFKDRTRRQSDDLAAIAAAMTQMEASAREVADSVRTTHELVSDVNEQVADNQAAAERGMASLAALQTDTERTAAKLRQLEQASLDIGRITAAIDDIANQTNLLALNAAIESARAGEAGRGFAVVADEVRGLAQKTTDSTDTIRELVEGLQHEAAETVASMNASFERLASVRDVMESVSDGAVRIRDAMGQIHQGAERIRHGMDEQESVSQSVAQQVNEISGAATENLDGIEELVATGERLEASVSHIESLTRQFRVG
ncbi:methyl-accepting chemotaxis protein [Marinobacter shengliensis]|uniref:methyl-accepting chemotaxis protein n=1 Tax=Marinobacter shengliensis TaxID=1389223 RepID=UPI000D1100BF|nr:methyl-accepting chemotaxis protein [Marinobacter shengliensis]PSF11078.1 methyl-accepting chemotaxis protein [Marinobacter shengliensis]